MSKFDDLLSRMPDKEIFNLPFNRCYLSLLKQFWSGDLKSLSSKIDHAIEKYIDHIQIYKLYRLWVETLITQEDFKSLELLKNHIGTMISNTDKNQEWKSILGLIDYELDKLSNCKDHIDSLKKIKKHNMYDVELLTKTQQRTNMEKQLSIDVFLNLSSITDYFVLENFARILLMNNYISELTKLLTKATNCFPGSPLENSYYSHLFFEMGDYDSSENHSYQLIKNFPQKLEYSFNLAYAMMCNYKIKDSVEILEKIEKEAKTSDPDILQLLAYGHLLLSKDKTDCNNWKKSKALFKLSQKQFNLQNIPTQYVDLNLEYIKQMEKRPATKEQLNYWTRQLSERHFSELIGAKEDQISILFVETFQFKPEHKSGDIVFFTHRSHSQQRLGAIYRIINNSINLKGHAVLTLELLKRFDERSIPIPIKAFKHAGIWKNTTKTNEIFFSQIEDVFPINKHLKSTNVFTPMWKSGVAS